MIDIHSHIIPDVDDGAESFEDSVNIINALKKIGYNSFVATPHWIESNRQLYSDGKIHKNFEELKRILPQKNISLGAEIFFDEVAFNELKANRLITYPSKKAVLIEFSLSSEAAPMNLEEIIFRINSKSCLPILAHPERYPFLQRNQNLILKLKQMEVGLLVDLTSLGGKFGWSVKHISQNWLKKGFFNACATDIHSCEDLKYINKGIDFIKKTLGKNALNFFENTPEQLLEGILDDL